MHYRIVQPWGADKAGQSTVVTERDTVESAFAEIDGIAAQMVKTGLTGKNPTPVGRSPARVRFAEGNRPVRTRA